MIAPVQGKVGQPVTFEGYADDYGSHIVALEFSLDGGTTWARQDVSASDPNLMVHWTYAYTPQQEGIYQLKVRPSPNFTWKPDRRPHTFRPTRPQPKASRHWDCWDIPCPRRGSPEPRLLQ